MALREATGAEQLFGIDLNFALLSRREEYRQLPDVSFVIASLFDLPFESESSTSSTVRVSSTTPTRPRRASRRSPRGCARRAALHLGLRSRGSPYARLTAREASSLLEQMSGRRSHAPLSSRSERDLQGACCRLVRAQARGAPAAEKRRSWGAHGRRRTPSTLFVIGFPPAMLTGTALTRSWGGLSLTGSGSTTSSHPRPTSGSSRIRSGGGDMTGQAHRGLGFKGPRV